MNDESKRAASRTRRSQNDRRTQALPSGFSGEERRRGERRSASEEQASFAD